MPLKPASDIVWCPSRLHRCSRYNHRTTFQNHLSRASTSINTRLRRASMPLKPALDILWCPSRLHRCSRNNHRAFQNDSPRASTSINTRLRRASFPLKPAPDIVWCPFPLGNTRNQHGLSAITTHLVSIANTYKVRGLSQKVVDFLYNKKTIRSIATKFYM